MSRCRQSRDSRLFFVHVRMHVMKIKIPIVLFGHSFKRILVFVVTQIVIIDDVKNAT